MRRRVEGLHLLALAFACGVVSKGYIYFALAFACSAEPLNICARKRDPIKLCKAQLGNLIQLDARGLKG